MGSAYSALVGGGATAASPAAAAGRNLKRGRAASHSANRAKEIRARFQARAASSQAAGGEEGEGHKVPGGAAAAATEEAEVASFQRHQQRAKRLEHAEEARTLVDLGRYGVLSTLSAAEGFPSGSVVGYGAREDNGLPIFVFSTLSSHTGDIDADCRCSLTVTAPGFRGASDGRVSITGRVFKVTDEARAAQLKQEYRAKHPNAFWADFGDFSVYEMTELVGVRLVGGFARAGSIKPEAFMAAPVDKIAGFSAPICGHMNDDHAEQIPLYVSFYTGMKVETAKMLSVDHLGMNVEASRDGQTFKVRLPYPEPAKDRKGVKDQIVSMSRAVAAAAKADEDE